MKKYIYKFSCVTVKPTKKPTITARSRRVSKLRVRNMNSIVLPKRYDDTERHDVMKENVEKENSTSLKVS